MDELLTVAVWLGGVVVTLLTIVSSAMLLFLFTRWLRRRWLRRRAHSYGWASNRELREWELANTKNVEYMRQLKGGG